MSTQVFYCKIAPRREKALHVGVDPGGQPDSMSRMRALVLEGGAMRSIFTAGVLDGLAGRGVGTFDLIIGVSAGAACASSYLAGQHGRNRRIFLEHMTGRRFIDPVRALRGGHYFDMGWLMGPLALDLDPIDVDALRRSAATTRLLAVAVRADTGEPAYLPAQGPDFLEALHATVAIPVLYRGGPARFRGRLYFDGGVVDPLPVARAIGEGADDVLVVPTHRRSWRPAPPGLLERLLMRGLMSRWPGLLRAAAGRQAAYEQSLALMRSPPAGVHLRVVAPPEEFRVTRYTRDRALLEEGYHQGKKALPDVF